VNCRDLAEVLIDYIGGELPPDEAERIRQHLDFCPPCVCYIETYQLTITLMRHLPQEPPPAALLDRLRAAMEEDRPQ
jgi:anti-sigma factor RsiW